MPKFFSDSWLTAVNAAFQESSEVGKAASGKDIVFEQIATGSPDGDVAYHLVIRDGQVRAVAGRADDPTVSITGPWDVHVKINKGELSPPVALLSGKGRARGDRMKLMTERALFSTIHDTTIGVPAEY